MLLRQKEILSVSLFVLLALVDLWLRFFSFERGEYVCNAGAFWGIQLPSGLLLAGSALLLVLALFGVWHLEQPLERFGGVIFGLGGLTNFLDRLAHDCVLDYFAWPLGLSAWLPDFNWGDMTLLLGVGLLMVSFWQEASVDKSAKAS